MKYYSEIIPADKLIEALNEKEAAGHEPVFIRDISYPVYKHTSAKAFLEEWQLRGGAMVTEVQYQCFVIFKEQINLQQLNAHITKAYDKLEIVASQTKDHNIKSVVLDAQIYLLAAELDIMPDKKKQLPEETTEPVELRFQEPIGTRIIKSYVLIKDFKHPIHPFKKGTTNHALGWFAIFSLGFVPVHNPTANEIRNAEKFCDEITSWLQPNKKAE